jgi:GT2 family glycosyltransferase
MTAVSLVLVAYRSSPLLPGAVAAFRRELGTAGLTGEVIVVDHSEDAAESERVEAARPDLLLRRDNRGYAAGVNAGLLSARGETVLVGNPDVELAPGALGELLAALRAGWTVVGPQFELAGTLFPPAEPQTPLAERARKGALSGPHAWRRYLRRQVRSWSRVWEARGPQPVETLSGALLAFPADLGRRAGLWDEDYFLYFEETDWLRRVCRAGGRLAVVPAARAAHRWGHAARPEAWTDRFAASQRRYYRRWFPLLGPLVLRLPVRPPPVPRPWAEAPEGAAWRWLLSPSPAGFPAALLVVERPVGEAAAAFCEASERPAVTLVAWRPGDGGLLGPFAWSPAGERAATIRAARRSPSPHE